MNAPAQINLALDVEHTRCAEAHAHSRRDARGATEGHFTHRQNRQTVHLPDDFALCVDHDDVARDQFEARFAHAVGARDLRFKRGIDVIGSDVIGRFAARNVVGFAQEVRDGAHGGRQLLGIFGEPRGAFGEPRHA